MGFSEWQNKFENHLLILGSTLTLLSAATFYDHYARPNAPDEISFLRKTSEYIQTYDGDQKEGLKYIEDRLKNFTKNNDLQITKISDLEKEVSEANGKASQQDLTYFGKKIDFILEGNEKTSSQIYNGIILGIFGVVLLIGAYKTRNYKDD